MYFCYFCNEVFAELNNLILHLKYQEFVKEKSSIKIKCVKEKNCDCTFQTFCALKKHLNKSHTLELNNPFADPNEAACTIASLEKIEDVYIHNARLDKSSELEIKTPTLSDFENAMKCFYDKLNLLGLPEQTMTDVFCQTKIITDIGINIISASSQINTTFNKIKISETMKNFCSKYKRKKLFLENSFYVEPQQIPIGFRWEMRFNRDSFTYSRKLIQNFFQFIPVTKTLTTIFKNSSFRNLFKDFNISHSCTSGIYKFGCCGDHFQSIKKGFVNETKVLIQLYYDDFEVARVLGSKTIVHKVGAIYFTIVNSPTNLKSNLQNIFLVSLFYVNDLHGDFNLNSILQPIVADIKILENDGVFIDKLGLVSGTILSLSHDNLAANDLIGFTKSFSAKFFCRFCIMPSGETKKSTTEDLKLLRTDDCYTILCDQPPLRKLKMMETQGISRNSVLNDLKYFHSIKNHSVDLLHDGLEGFVVLVLKYQFEFFIEQKVFTNIDKINNCISAYNFGFIDRRNKPSNINLEKSNLGQNAIQVLCLATHFPFIFDRFYDQAHQYQWKAVLSVIEIIIILFRHELTDSDIKHLQSIITSHLESIKTTFKKDLTPKQHFLLHYPTVIRRMGPVIHLWTMRYEGKHRYFKKNITPNFINICQSFAKRHQQMMSNVWANSTFKTESQKGKKSLYNSNISYNCLDRFSRPIFSLSYFISDFHYKKGFCILKEKSSHQLIHVYNIIDILECSNEIYFLMSEFIGIYDKFYCGYQLIEKNSSPICLNFNSLQYKKAYEKHFVCKTKNFYLIGCNVQLI